MSIKVSIGPKVESRHLGAVIDDSPEHFVPASPSNVSSSEGEDKINIAVVGPKPSISFAESAKGKFGRFARQVKVGVLLVKALILTRDEAKKTGLLVDAIGLADEGLEILLDEIRRFGMNDKRAAVFNELYGQRMAILKTRFEASSDFNLMIKCADLMRKGKAFEEFIQGHRAENSIRTFVPYYEARLAEFVGLLSKHFYLSLDGDSVADPKTIYAYLKIMAGKSALESTKAVAEKVLFDLVKHMVAHGEFDQASELLDYNRKVLVSGKAADLHLKLAFEEFMKVFEEAMPRRIAFILDPSGKDRAALKVGQYIFKTISEALMQTLRMAPAKQAIAVFYDGVLTEMIKGSGFYAGGFGKRSVAFEITSLVAKYFSCLSGVDIKLFGGEASAGSYFKSLYSSTIGSPLKLGGYVFHGVRPPEYRPPVQPDSGLVVTNIEHGRDLPRELLEELRQSEREFSKALGRVNRVRLRFEKK